MKLAISNLAWSPEQDGAVAALLGRLGVHGVELAPTKLWPKPLEATSGAIAACRRFWEGHGLPIRALQALLFGRPELTIFDDGPTRERTLRYLAAMCCLAGQLGASALVFGSPRNRLVGARTADEVFPVALDFFNRAADAAESYGVTLCLEPNPPQYGCDWMTRADDAAALVRAVNRPGFGLHLDTACTALAGDSIFKVLPRSLDCLRHFHVSEPQLGPVGSGAFDHASAAEALEACGYRGWISIEMKPTEGDATLVAVERACRFVQDSYLGRVACAAA